MSLNETGRLKALEAQVQALQSQLAELRAIIETMRAENAGHRQTLSLNKRG